MLYGLLRCGLCGAKLSAVYGAPSNHGTCERYYNCYYHDLDNRSLEQQGKERCSLQRIPADLLENYVYDGLMARLGYNRTDYVPVISTVKCKEKIIAVQENMKNLEDRKNKTKLKLERLDLALEEAYLNIHDWGQKRNEALKEIQKLDIEIKEAVQEIERLNQLKEQEELLVKFGHEEKEALTAIYHSLFKLSHDKKRRLLQGLLAGPIVVRPFDDKLGLGDVLTPEALQKAVDMSFTFNPEIIEEMFQSSKNRKIGGNPSYDFCYLRLVFELAA